MHSQNSHPDREQRRATAAPATSMSASQRIRRLQQEENMAATASAGIVTGKPLIESDRVEGTAVYDRKGTKIGAVKRLTDRQEDWSGRLHCPILRRLLGPWQRG